jgi:hypothetical protein
MGATFGDSLRRAEDIPDTVADQMTALACIVRQADPGTRNM